MRILSVKQLKPIQVRDGGFIFPLSSSTKIILDRKGKKDRKTHELIYQSNPRYYGNVGDCCEYLNNDELLALEEKGMIEIKKAVVKP